MTSVCQGYYLPSVPYDGKLDPALLLDDIKPGVDGGATTWYALKDFQPDAPEARKGTFKHFRCLGVTIKDSKICPRCDSIPNLPSFKKRLLLRNERIRDGVRNTHSIRFGYLSMGEQLEALRDKCNIIKQKESENFFLKSKQLRLKIRTRSLKEKIKEFATRGDFKTMAYKLAKAGQEGKLTDRIVLADTLQTVASNLHVKEKGKRFRASVQQFYESILILGGPRLASFVSYNLHGPDIHTVYTWRQKRSRIIDADASPSTFQQLTQVYAEAKKKANINFLVPVMTAEDETAVKAEVAYHQETDELLGFCGENKDHHCLQPAKVIIGDDRDAYSRLTSAFQNLKIGAYARVVLLNPLHLHLPRMAILLLPTCNKFTHSDVAMQWSTISENYQAYTESTVGPLIGNASDGDSRRRKLMLENMSCNQGERYQPIPRSLGFHLTAKKEICEDTYTIRQVGDQDYIHQHKKLINALDQESRILTMGSYNIHLNHIQLVAKEFDVRRHHLTKDHLERRDRQNWKVAQELAFTRVQDCLSEILHGSDFKPPNPTVLGTRTYLEVVWHYVEVFVSPSASLTTRITYAGFVCHFLGIWRNFVLSHPSLTVATNFISREAYQDCLISLHFAVLLICYMRDCFPGVDCMLHLTGSDCCENFFSINGQWVGNRHSYNFGEMTRNLRQMSRLHEIQVDPNGPIFKKAHIKQENVWAKQYENGPTVNLSEYPAKGDEVTAWEEGIALAHTKAKAVGMKPTYFSGDAQEDPNNPDQRWFYKPFYDTEGDNSDDVEIVPDDDLADVLVPRDVSSSVPDGESSTVPEDVSSLVPDGKSSTIPRDVSSSVSDGESSTIPEDVSSPVHDGESSTIPEDVSSPVRDGESSTIPEDVSSPVRDGESSTILRDILSPVPDGESSTIPRDVSIPGGESSTIHRDVSTPDGVLGPVPGDIVSSLPKLISAPIPDEDLTPNPELEDALRPVPANALHTIPAEVSDDDDGHRTDAEIQENVNGKCSWFELVTDKSLVLNRLNRERIINSMTLFLFKEEMNG